MEKDDSAFVRPAETGEPHVGSALAAGDRAVVLRRFLVGRPQRPAVPRKRQRFEPHVVAGSRKRPRRLQGRESRPARDAVAAYRPSALVDGEELRPVEGV